MVVNAFVVDRFDPVPGDAGLALQPEGHRTDDILDKHGIGIGLIGDKLLIGAFEQGIDRRRGGGFRNVDQLLDPDELPPPLGIEGGPHVYADMTSLVVSPLGAHRLAARTEARYRHLDPEDEVVTGGARLADKAAFVFHQAPGPADRRPLFQEVGETQLYAGAFRLQVPLQVMQDGGESIHGDAAAVPVEDFHEPAHVGPLEVVRQVDRHGDVCHGPLFVVLLVQDNDRVAQVADPHLVNRDITIIMVALDIDHTVYLRCLLRHWFTNVRFA